MVAEIEGLVARLGVELGGRSLSDRVLSVMRDVPRHEFVPAGEQAGAYRNRPVQLPYGQTVSQPFMVALMTDLLEVRPTDCVLEVGTGSGYQAAILSRLAREVFTIEIVEPLARQAKLTFERLGIKNIRSRIGDGYVGWPEEAPFDAIIVTAAPDHIPAQLIAQLRAGGRLVIPVGTLQQDLMVVQKKPDGTTTSSTLIPVRFVPLTRGGDEPQK